VARTEARAISRTELAPVEPVTVILSQMGWVRTAKGHEIDPGELIYKSGDGFLTAACGRSNQPAVFIDSTGRTYAGDPNSFPTARSYGIPLTGIFSMASGARFVDVLMGEPERSLLIASTAGYGFIAVLEDMVTRNTKGKAFLSLSEGAVPLSPIPIEGEGEELLVAAVTRQGRMLAFPIGELPRLPKGKGNKIIHIHSKEVHSGEDGLAFLKLLSSRHKLVVHAGKRSFTMSFNLVRDFLGERGKRGKKLPRGFQRVTELASEQVGA